MEAELPGPLLQRHLEVGFPEELGIGEARPDDALVAGHDGGAAVARQQVGGEQEAVGKRRLARAAHHEALLVGPDSGPDGLGRDVQKRLVEAAHQHHGPFDQPGHFVEQRRILDEVQPLREGEVARVVQDDGSPPLGVEHHPRLLERRGVVVEAPHGKGRGRHEPVAPRGISGRDTGDRERHDLGLLGVGRKGAEDRL